MLKLFTQENTPLFTTDTFAQEYERGFSHFADEQNLYRNLQCILFPGTEVYASEDGSVVVPSYSERPFFLDQTLLGNKQKRIPVPSKEAILNELHSLVGTPYVWGGNIPTGISEKGNYIDGLRGLDCSGLFYYVARGHVPRNTSHLMEAGVAVSLRDIQPLDIIVWQGHMVIAISPFEVIESLHDEASGVRIVSLEKRLPLIGKPFVIRRVL